MFTVTASVPRLEIRNLLRSFDGKRVVDDVSLTVKAGQVIGLLGPSGCGKTTTLRIIAGIEQQDGGEVYVDGQLISDAQRAIPPEKRGIGLMFQDYALFPHLSVAENIAFGLKGSHASRADRVAELLARVNMSHYRDAMPHALSGGEQQRIALARALAPRPRIMLMDEPFSGLDNRLRDEIRDQTLAVLKSEETAVLLVTHEPEEAMRMADDIVLMRSGRMIQTGTPWQLYHAPVDLRAAAFFSDVNVIPARVQNEWAATPFGTLAAAGHADGAEVRIAIRPQYLQVALEPPDQDAAQCTVIRARFMGQASLLEVQMAQDGVALTVLVPNVCMPQPGSTLWLTARHDCCFVFAPEG
jgi:iron(III) transport system ATP-binding protein